MLCGFYGGYPNDLGLAVAMTEDFLVGFKIHIVETATVLKFGVIGPNGQATKKLRLAVYSHNASGDQPKDLLFQSGEINLSPGVNEVAVGGNEVLVADTDYWLMGLFAENLNVNGADSGAMEVHSAYYTQAGLYPTFPSPVVATTYTGPRMNFYILLDGGAP